MQNIRFTLLALVRGEKVLPKLDHFVQFFADGVVCILKHGGEGGDKGRGEGRDVPGNEEEEGDTGG